MKKKSIFKVHDYQQEAITNTINALKKDDRCQIHMAPGSGKTIIALQIHEQINSSLTLFCAPTIDLLYQSLMSWANKRSESKPYSALIVCSTDMSQEDKDELKELQQAQGAIARKSSDIATFIRKPGNKVIFSTYKSVMKVGAALTNDGLSVDLGIFDEAHHVAGDIEKDATKVLLDEHVPIKKRVFLTATPRVTKSRAKNNNNWYGMEKKEHFGEPAYELTFRDAVEKDILTDYRLMIPHISKAEAEAFGVGDTLDEKVALLSTVRSIVDFDLKKGLTFHNSVKRATEFSDKLALAFDVLGYKDYAKIYTLSYKDSIDEKKRVITALEYNKNPSLITNVRVLGEGFDFSALDFIVIVDPKSSAIDIVQNIGRVMRKHDEKTVAKIILPVVLNSTDDLSTEFELYESSYGSIKRVMDALQTFDHMIETEAGKSQKGRSVYEKYNVFVQNHIEIASIGDEKTVRELYNSLTMKFVDIIAGPVWKRVDELEKWCEEHGRLPRHSSKEPRSVESKYASRMNNFTCKNTTYGSDVTKSVREIISKYGFTPPPDWYNYSQLSEKLNRSIDSIRRIVRINKINPIHIQDGGGVGTHYFDEKTADIIKSKYAAVSVSAEKIEDYVTISEALEMLGKSYGDLVYLRKKYNININGKKIAGVDNGLFITNKEFEWLTSYFECGSNESPKRRAEIRKVFIENNPLPGTPVKMSA